MTRSDFSPLFGSESLAGRRRFLAACLGRGGLGILLTMGVACRRETGLSERKPSDPVPSESAADDFSESSSRRVISVVPSVTETLFALGLGDRIVAVSDFCRWPPETKPLPKVGGLLNPNMERIAELRPDLVVLTKDHAVLKSQLEKRFKLKTLTVDHSSITGVLDSFETLGRRFGPKTQRRGIELREELTNRIADVRRRTSGLTPVNAMISIDRTRGTGQITQVFVAGNNPYFNEILAVAGGRNVFASSTAAVPTVSREGILEKNPDVIFDFSTDGCYTEEIPLTDALTKVYRNDWNSLGDGIGAVKNGRIYPILTDYATVPGPRLILLIEKLAALLHSEQPNQEGL